MKDNFIKKNDKNNQCTFKVKKMWYNIKKKMEDKVWKILKQKLKK